MPAYTTFSDPIPLCLLPCPDLRAAATLTFRALEQAGVRVYSDSGSLPDAVRVR